MDVSEVCVLNSPAKFVDECGVGVFVCVRLSSGGDDLPPLQPVEGAVDEASKMEEVD